MQKIHMARKEHNKALQTESMYRMQKKDMESDDSDLEDTKVLIKESKTNVQKLYKMLTSAEDELVEMKERIVRKNLRTQKVLKSKPSASNVDQEESGEDGAQEEGEGGAAQEEEEGLLTLHGDDEDGVATPLSQKSHTSP